MGYPDIAEKLKVFLTTQPFTEERDVVYLLVEIRKLIEHKKLPRKYPILKFYCDWAVHTDKESITPEIKQIMQKIYEEIKIRILEKRHIMKPNSLDFIDMKHLRDDMRNFLQDAKFPDVLVSGSRNWPRFQMLLAKVLTDQPIKSPCPGIKEYKYILTGDPKIIQTEAIFEKKPAEYSTFKVEERFNF